MAGDRLVYSTDGGRVRPSPHNRKVAPPPSAPARQLAPDDGIVRIHRDRKGRGGKAAMLISGLPGDEASLEATLKRLKQSLGTGGSRDGRLLIVQGEQRERLAELLGAMGHQVKLAGG